MLIEGRGMVVPTPIEVKLSRGEVEFFHREAARRHSYRRYERRLDQWGIGMINRDDPCRSVLVGLVGEHALNTFLNKRLGTAMSVDLDLRPDGDGGRDGGVCGLTWNMKTKARDYRGCLVKRVDEKKRLNPIGCDILVYGLWTTDCLSCWLLGWIYKSDAITHGRLEKSRVGGHWNLNVDESALEAMPRLITAIQSRRSHV